MGVPSARLRAGQQMHAFRRGCTDVRVIDAESPYAVPIIATTTTIPCITAAVTTKVARIIWLCPAGCIMTITTIFAALHDCPPSPRAAVKPATWCTGAHITADDDAALLSGGTDMAVWIPARIYGEAQLKPGNPLPSPSATCGQVAASYGTISWLMSRHVPLGIY